VLAVIYIVPCKIRLPRFLEAPFTYLALLKDKLNLELGTSVVAGTIKVLFLQPTVLFHVLLQ
jgi:hypothetical protein